jgi:hypothetical protein
MELSMSASTPNAAAPTRRSQLQPCATAGIICLLLLLLLSGASGLQLLTAPVLSLVAEPSAGATACMHMPSILLGLLARAARLAACLSAFACTPSPC